MKTILGILIIITCLNVSYVHAGEFKDDEYHTFVKDVFIPAKTIEKENYQKIRQLYTKTSFYDPNFPPMEVKDILKSLGSDNLTKDKEEALIEELKLFTRKHMAHIYVHYSISNFYNNRGDSARSKRHATIANYLALTVDQTGDGLTPETAYKSINKSEEQFLIQYFLNRRYSSVELKNINHQLYSVYKTKHEKTLDEKDIYFNISDYYGKGVTNRKIKEAMEQKKQ